MKKRLISLLLCAILLLPLFCACGMKSVENEYVMTLPGVWEGAKDASEGLAAVCKNGKWGFIDTDGDVVIEPQYDDVHSFSEGLAAVRKNNWWGFIDKTGAAVIPCAFSYTSSFYEGRAVYGEGYYYGYIDTDGNRITPAVFTQADRFRGGAACAKKDGAYGFIAPDGTEITGFVYGMPARFSEGLAAVFPQNAKEGINTGYIDVSGNTVIPFDRYDGKNFSEGLAAVQTEYTKPWSYINKEGSNVIAAQWDTAEDFHNGRALVEKDQKYTFIDTDGNRINEAFYDKAYSFTDSGLARVGTRFGTGYKFGFIGQDGKSAIEQKYDNAMDFHHGYAAVCSGEKWGFVSADGTEITGQLWTEVGEMTEDGIAWVCTKDTYAFIRLK